MLKTNYFLPNNYTCNTVKKNLLLFCFNSTLLVLTYNFATAITETTTWCLFWLTIFTCLPENHNPQITNTGNQIITGLLISKLWVKTRSKHPYNRATTNPRIQRSRKNKKANWQQQYTISSNTGSVKESILSLQKCRVELFGICGFGGYFCFNSKPSFANPSNSTIVKESIFSLQKCGVELFRNSDFGANFCFNSKPSFSCESWRRRITFPAASK